MKEDRDQTSRSPHDADSYSVSHYHSDLNSIFTVCFSPEGSIHQRRQTNNSGVGFVTCKSAAQPFFYSMSIKKQLVNRLI